MSKQFAHEDSSETIRLLGSAAEGDREALSNLLARHHRWLTAFAAARIDPRISARVDAADVVQETEAQVSARLDDYLRRQPVSFRTWLLKTAFDQLGKLRRQHIMAACRSVLSEVPLNDHSSLGLAEKLMASQDAPWKRVSRDELAKRVRLALARLAEKDREVLLLRHVEGLSNQEIGYLLELDPNTVSKRHGRALLRLHAELAEDGVGSSDS